MFFKKITPVQYLLGFLKDSQTSDFFFIFIWKRIKTFTIVKKLDYKYSFFSNKKADPDSAFPYRCQSLLYFLSFKQCNSICHAFFIPFNYYNLHR